VLLKTKEMDMFKWILPQDLLSNSADVSFTFQNDFKSILLTEITFTERIG
jgi:hypothetical protein